MKLIDGRLRLNHVMQRPSRRSLATNPGATTPDASTRPSPTPSSHVPQTTQDTADTRSVARTHSLAMAQESAKRQAEYTSGPPTHAARLPMLESTSSKVSYRSLLERSHPITSLDVQRKRRRSAPAKLWPRSCPGSVTGRRRGRHSDGPSEATSVHSHCRAPPYHARCCKCPVRSRSN